MDTQVNQMMGADTSGQVVSGLMIIILVILVFLTAQFIYTYITNARNRFQTLLDYTANAEDMTLTIRQDASKYPDAKPIGLSMNERTGIEFSYSLYMYINSSTFTGNSSFKHVFHKGYSTSWPLMGPGVFVHGDTNTLRVMMNTYKNPYTYADVKNIPVQKWFHLVLNCYKGWTFSSMAIWRTVLRSRTRSHTRTSRISLCFLQAKSIACAVLESPP